MLGNNPVTMCRPEDSGSGEMPVEGDGEVSLTSISRKLEGEF